MKLRHYLWDRALALTLNVCGVTAAALFIGMTASWLTAGVIAAGWACGACAFFVTDYILLRRRVARVRAVALSAEDKFMLSETVPAPSRVADRLYYEVMLMQGRAAIARVSEAESRMREHRETVEEWVHEIKIPITAATLICGRNEGEDFRELSRQVDRISDLTERVLYAARCDDPSRDKLIRPCELSAVVNECLKDNKRLFIERGASVRTDVKGRVYTDAKWVAFVLKQLLVNALQYARGSADIEITTSASESATELKVLDCGIGIPAADLPRVFDKGFTGSNGRRERRSTGLGLYLCRKLCDALDVGLSVRSKEGEWTEFTLVFGSAV